MKLQGQPFVILEILLAHAGKVVTREEIRGTLWPSDTFVDFEHGLNTSVKKLRQVLCDSADEPSYIETVRGLGYRFIAPVEVELEETEPPARWNGAPESGPHGTRPHPENEQVVMARGTAEEVPAAASMTLPLPSPTAPTPNLRKAAVFVLVALVVLLAAGALLYRQRVNRQIRLTENDTVVLADFDNSTGDAIFDETLKTALNLSLRQSPFLNVLPETKVGKTLQLMTRPAGTKLTPELARELCQRAGSKAYIAGAIGSLGKQYVLALEAVNCRSGESLAREQVTAASRDQVLAELGVAASRLRAKLGESLAGVQKFDTPLPEATTFSLEALQAFSLGRKVLNEKGPAAALPYRQRAIELDPNFAMGYLVVGDSYRNMSEVGRAREYYTRAFQLREHSSQREKLAILASYYSVGTGELEKAAQTYQQEIESYPRVDSAYGNLGSVYAEQGRYEKALEVTKEAERLSPDTVSWRENIANNDLALQRFDEARQALNEAQARKLDDYILHNALYGVAFLDADLAGMAEQERWYASRPEYENFGLALESDTEAYAGHLSKARELTKRAVATAVRADSKENGAIWQANAAVAEAAYGKAVDARRSAEEALKLAPASESVESEAALALAMAGDTKRAKVLTQDLAQRFPLDDQMRSIWLPAIRGQLALDEKNPVAALSALPVGSPITGSPISASPIEFGQQTYVNNLSCLYPTYVRGEAYLDSGQGRAASAEFQKIIDHSGIVWNCWTGALAHLGVARANALDLKTARGPDVDAARFRALAAYKNFFKLWKDADANLPILKQAKSEYAKLQ
jgi:DNA-binding winged helix-turn-helix (wHTH) protein/tetratricopeptide (TPR) repeat protein